MQCLWDISHLWFIVIIFIPEGFLLISKVVHDGIPLHILGYQGHAYGFTVMHQVTRNHEAFLWFGTKHKEFDYSTRTM